ncbi:MAG: hypothetical protein VX667_05670, partial [Nitrospinota bacterium]|nr:hypothetical protein [Nitrospinota bacterium]
LSSTTITSSGTLGLTGATGIDFGAGSVFTAGGTLTMSTTSGGVTGQGALTLQSAGGITLSEDLTTAGATVITADSDGNGAGTFTLNSGKTVSTGNNSLTITADDFALSGSLNSGTAGTTVLVSDGGTIGLGATAGNLTIIGSELQNITANTLTVGNGSTGNITVNGITSTNSANVGTVSLVAGASNSTITFDTAASSFSALSLKADGDIALNTGVTTTGATTLTSNSGNTIGLGSANCGSSCSVSLTQVDLSNMTAASLTIGDSLGGNIFVDNVTATGAPMTLSTGSGRTVSFVNSNGNSTFGALTVNAGTGGVVFSANQTATSNLVVNSGGSIIGTSGSLAVTGTAGLNTSVAGSAITLSNTGNTFSGTTSLNTAGTSGNATLVSNSNLILGNSNVGGNLGVTVGGTSKSLTVNGSQTAGGNISLLSDDDIAFNASGSLITTSGNITVTADNDSSGGGSGGALTMADGVVINTGSGTIVLRADENVTLGRLITTSNSDSAVTLTSTSGGIFDGGDLGGADVDALNGRLVADTVTGFGLTGNPVETRVRSVDIDNTTSGDVDIFEADALEIFKINQTGPENIRVSHSGNLTGQKNATVPLASLGKIFFIQRFISVGNSRIIGDTGKRLDDLSVERTVGLAVAAETEFTSHAIKGFNTRGNTVTGSLGNLKSGPFMVDVFSENFGLVEVDTETRKVYGDLGGLESFWGDDGSGPSNLARRDGRSGNNEQATIERGEDNEKEKKAQGRIKPEFKKAKVKKVGQTASTGR